MDEEFREEEQEVSTGGSLQTRHLAMIVIVAVVVVGGLLFFLSRRGAPPPVVPERIVDVPEGTRAVTLYFASRDAETLVAETRLVAIGKRYDAQVEQVLEALLEGPEEEDEGVSTTAPGTKLLGVFYDPDGATLYVDFSSELVAGHPGGSSAEYFTIAAIMRTVSQNFPEVEAVQFLVEGLQVGTIAGHIDAYRPFRVSDWR